MLLSFACLELVLAQFDYALQPGLGQKGYLAARLHRLKFLVHQHSRRLLTRASWSTSLGVPGSPPERTYHSKRVEGSVVGCAVLRKKTEPADQFAFSLQARIIHLKKKSPWIRMSFRWVLPLGTSTSRKQFYRIHRSQAEPPPDIEA